MKIIFAGTPELALPSLEALIASEHEIVAVYTKPDKPAGRGQKVTVSPVKALASQHALPVLQPVSLRDPLQQQILRELQADLMIVIAYGLILPEAVLTMPRLGCINIHVSLLPRWRGASPIQQAILAGDSETGISIMQMDAGLDTGPVFSQLRCPIYAEDNSSLLHDRLAALGAEALMSTLPSLLAGTCIARPQNNALACYAKKLDKQDALINWSDTAAHIQRQIRAFNPWPVAHTFLNGQLLRIWQAELTDIPTTQTPGALVRVDKKAIMVATGDKLLRLSSLQLPGGRALSAAELLNGRAELFKEEIKLGNS